MLGEGAMSRSQRGLEKRGLHASLGVEAPQPQIVFALGYLILT